MLHYEIILYWSNEEQVFTAETPELSGCMAHGNSQEEALANMMEAMQLWIETAEKYEDEIPQPKTNYLR